MSRGARSLPGPWIRWALLALAWPAAASALDVAVLPLAGAGPPQERTQRGRAVIDALVSVEGLRVYSLLSVKELLGAPAEAAIAACTDDPCLVAATRAVRTDLLVAGRIEEEAGRFRVQLRTIATSTRGAARAVATRELPVADGERAVAAVLSLAALDLFPELAAKSHGTLVLFGLVPGARVFADGRLLGEVPLDKSDAAFRVRTGAHALTVIASGRRSYESKVQISAGQKSELTVQLEKNRSSGPLILGGLGAGAGALGLVLGIIAANTASSWKEGCPAGMPCGDGFTAQRYSEDRSAVDRSRTSANTLFVISGLALAAGGVWYLLDPGVDEVQR